MRANGGPLGLIVTVLLAALGTMGFGSAEPSPASRAPRKRALLVAVGAYAPETGWETLASETDLNLVGEALQHHGFKPSRIRTLRGPGATRVGILGAIEHHLLEPAEPGDVLVLLLSGHGQRLTDGTDADELDGYDEAFVPWDAPRLPPSAYQGDKHLRDDELGEVVDRLRHKVGPSGEVLVLLDSCFSGTGTRGDAAMRGGPPIGSPRSSAGVGRTDEGGGFWERPQEEGQSSASGLSPQIVFTAARSDQTAYETKTVDGRPVGALSRAFARGLWAPGLDPTYRGLADEIRWQMASYLLPQQPQAEGDLDRGLLGGRAVRPVPYLKVSTYDAERNRLVIRPGSLVGLEQGAEVQVHEPGTVIPTLTTRLSQGRVEQSTYAEATVQLATPIQSKRPIACRVFVTRYSFGGLQMRVKLVGPQERSSKLDLLTDTLEKVSAVRLVQDHPDFLINWEPVSGIGSDRHPTRRGWMIREAASGEEVARVSSDHPVPEEALAERLRSLARNRYLRRINLFDPRFHVDFEIVPVEVTSCRDPRSPSLRDCAVVPLGPAGTQNSTGPRELALGTYFRIRVAPGEQKAYLTVLDLMPNGQIEVLWPPRGVVEPIHPGQPRLLPILYRTVEPAGLDQLLLIASEEFLDFRPFRWVEPLKRRRGFENPEPLRLGPFQPLFDDFFGHLRSQRLVIESGRVSTASKTMRVVTVP